MERPARDDFVSPSLFRLDSPARRGRLKAIQNSLPPATRMKMANPSNQQTISIERHGDVAVITPSSEVEKMPENLMEQAAQMLLAPLRDDPPAGLTSDLSKPHYVGPPFPS